MLRLEGLGTLSPSHTEGYKDCYKRIYITKWVNEVHACYKLKGLNSTLCDINVYRITNLFFFLNELRQDLCNKLVDGALEISNVCVKIWRFLKMRKKQTI